MTYGVVVELGRGLLVYGIPFIIVVGWFSSRLLGVHRGWGRSLVAGFFGWVVGVAVAAVDRGPEHPDHRQLDDVLLLALFFGVLISMFVGLILDVILKPKHGKHHRFRWLLHPIATIKRRLAPLGRSREILRYARKRGLKHYASASKLVTPEFARRLRLTLEDCGGMFVKFGQIASTRTDLLPEVLTTELAQLQSSARPVPADEVREVIEQRAGRHGGGGVRVVRLRAAGGGVDRPDPPGGAQDRRARRGEGAASRDRGHRAPRRRGAAHGRRLRRTARRSGAPARRQAVGRGAHHLAGEASSTTAPKRRAASRSSSTSTDDEGIAAPNVYQSLSTRRVLVMEEINGVTVADHAAVEAAPDVGQRAGEPAPAVVPRPGAARRSVPRRPAPGEHLRRPPGACCGSSTSARSGG